jgi:hypothetical protein
MSNVYTEEMVNQIVFRLSRRYRAKIKRLTDENERLKERLSFAESEKGESGGADEASEAELDMDKILRPNGDLNLENLCKELGLMDDND